MYSMANTSPELIYIESGDGSQRYWRLDVDAITRVSSVMLANQTRKSYYYHDYGATLTLQISVVSGLCARFMVISQHSCTGAEWRAAGQQEI